MSTDCERALRELESSCDIRDEHDLRAYIGAIDHLRPYRDRAVLRRMLLCLRDVDAQDVQYDLVEACEAYPIEDYIPVLVEVAETLSRSSPWWFDLLLHSVCNAESYWLVLKKELRESSNKCSRAFFEGVLSRMGAEDHKYVTLLDELRTPA